MVAAVEVPRHARTQRALAAQPFAAADGFVDR